MDVVEIWTGRHAHALRVALRLTNEAMAKQLGAAVRTVAKWNAETDLVQSPELQRALDTVLAKATEVERRRFGLLFTGSEAGIHTEDGRETETRLATDQATAHALRWIDDRAEWRSGAARRLLARLSDETDPREVRDRAQVRGRVGRQSIAAFLERFYDVPSGGYSTYRARCHGEVVETSVLTRPEWLDVAVSMGTDQEQFDLDGALAPPTPVLDERTAEAAVRRLAIGVAMQSRMVDSKLYRLASLAIGNGMVRGTFGLTDFVAYALSMDLLEGETIDAIAAGLVPTRENLPLRARLLPSLDSVVRFGDRLCAGGPVALFAAARPAGRTRSSRGPDYVLLVQERSGRVLNSAHRLAVIPKAFHEPLVDYRGEVSISSTLGRELEEELFGRPEVDSTSDGFRRADPLHPSRLTAPLTWLVDRLDAWRMECTAFGLNLVSGNFEFASLILIEDDEWWGRFGGSIQANWEADGLRQYSSLDPDLVGHLVHDASWSNEGLFAFLQGLRRLSQIGGPRVNLPMIDWDLNG